MRNCGLQFSPVILVSCFCKWNRVWIVTANLIRVLKRSTFAKSLNYCSPASRFFPLELIYTLAIILLDDWNRPWDEFNQVECSLRRKNSLVLSHCEFSMVITEIRCRAIDLPMSAVRFKVRRMTLFAFIIAFITNVPFITNVMQLRSHNMFYFIETNSTIMILIVSGLNIFWIVRWKINVNDYMLFINLNYHK